MAFEPAGPSSLRPAPPNPGQLVRALLHERETGMSMDHMFVGVEALRSMTQHGVSFEVAWVGEEPPRRSEKTALASRTQRTLGASTPVHGRSRRLRSRGRSPHSKEGHENFDWSRRTSRWGGPIERFGLAARVARGSRDRTREWQAVRRRSRTSFFSGSVRPACGTRKHGRGGSRAEADCSRESKPERSRRRRSARCENDDE